MTRIPSVKTLSRISPEHAGALRQLLERNADYLPFNGNRIKYVLGQANTLIDAHGVEYIPPGDNAKSPGISYVNLGDPYTPTLMVIDGKPLVGCWGTIVERGSYP